MKHTQEEIRELLERLTPEEIKKGFEELIDPDYKNSIWYEIDQYYAHMEPRPYSMRDMVPKVFHKDLCKKPAQDTNY